LLTLTTAAMLMAVVFTCALVATWLVRAPMRSAPKLDPPHTNRKTHRAPVAYEGGVAIWLACLTGILIATVLRPAFVFDLRLLQGLIIGGTLIVAVGAADDLLDLPPVVKLLAQLAVGLLMHHFGFRIERFSNPFGDEMHVLPQVSYVVTAVWYALLMNGINMIDGMDGLAAGIVAISSLTLAAVALDLDQPLAVALGLVLAASCLGFLPFNYIPATIFMGDAGSMLLGFMLASITLLSSTKAPALLALIIPMLAVALPLFETVFAFVRRAAQGKHPFRADRRHLHHRFLALGFSQRRTLFTFYYITAYFGVTAYVLQRLEAKATLALVAIISLGMLVLIENMRFLERKNG
jgi:UDP-GlcNAc:undecaprenyl-phosphate GlcNAc-1-phosphate transferase